MFATFLPVDGRINLSLDGTRVAREQISYNMAPDVVCDGARAWFLFGGHVSCTIKQSRYYMMQGYDGGSFVLVLSGSCWVNGRFRRKWRLGVRD